MNDSVADNMDVGRSLDAGNDGVPAPGAGGVEPSWEQRFAELLEFRRTHGHLWFSIVSGYEELARWFRTQAQLAWNTGVSPARLRTFQEAGVELLELPRTIKAEWEEFFAQLKAFKGKSGHCQVKAGTPLAAWLGIQRNQDFVSTIEQRCRLETLLGEKLRPAAPLGSRPASSLPGANWKGRFTELLEFRRKHGHLFVSIVPEASALGLWLRTQAQLAKRGELPYAQLCAFEQAGIVVSALPPTQRLAWEEFFEELKAFKEQHGHCRAEAGTTLAAWLGIQRNQDFVSTIEQRLRLESLLGEKLKPSAPLRRCPVSTSGDSEWEQRLAELLEFRRKHGHLYVSLVAESRTLANWLRAQAQLARRCTLTHARVCALEQADVPVRDLPATRREEWEHFFSQLEKLKESQGHCRVEAGTPLAAWLDIQQKRSLSEGTKRLRRLRLEALLERKLPRMVFAPPRRISAERAAAWKVRFAELVAFKARFGHCRVPDGWKENLSLAQWLAYQAYCARRGALEPNRLKRLLKLGMKITPTMQEKHQQRLTELEQFQQRFGHGQIPPDWPENRLLAQWLDLLRSSWREGKLSPELIEQLSRLGVCPERPPRMEANTHGRIWDQMFETLRAYRERFGHCVVPHYWAENQVLANWLNAQRRRARAGRLPEEKQQRLAELGVIFENRRCGSTSKVLHPDFALMRCGRGWEASFRRLETFCREHGHCVVPREVRKFRSLHGWLQIQRHHARAGLLNRELKRRLQELGVSFKAERIHLAWEENLAALSVFKKHFGHCRVPYALEELRPLYNWLKKQHEKARFGRILPQRRKQLEELGVRFKKASSRKQAA